MNHKLLITKKWLLAGGLICAAITNLNAATVPVTSLADDGTPGTLRAALAAANDGDMIDATGVSGTITLLPQFVMTSSQLGITKSVTILGPGPANLTINGNGTSRVFLIHPDHTVTIEGLTIANGLASGAPAGSFPPNSGGGIYNDQSTLTLSNCVIRENSADSRGGGIFNDRSAVTLRNCVVSENSAVARGGGILSEGVSSLTIENCIFNLNSSDTGGGIGSDEGATVNVTTCTFSENFAANSGGAIHAVALFEGSIKVTSSTFDRNSAAGSGGGAIHGNGPMDVISSTFVANTAALSGGGIEAFEDMNVANCTFSGNTAAFLGGGLKTPPSTRILNLYNSTFSGNTAEKHGGNIFADGELHIGSTILRGGSPQNIVDNGTIISHGFNLSSDAADGDGGTGPGGFLNATGDRRNTDPMLGPLADNGGPTLTHLPLPGSPAIDQGTSDTLLFLGIMTDQRGFARTVDDLSIANAFLGDGTDIGAVEFTPPPPPNNPPVAKCKNVIVLAGAGGVADASIDDGSSDPDGDAITPVQDPPGPYPIGTTSVTLTVTDSHGASSSCTANVTVQGVTDLLLSLGADKRSVKPGDLLTYTITIKNFGPDKALNLVINDIMSSGTTFVSAQANKGLFTAPPVNQTGTVTWSLADLPSGEAEGAQLVVKVLIKGKTTVTNSASVTADTSDPNTQNNSASITTTVDAGGGGKRK